MESVGKIKDMFKQMRDPVKLVVFTDKEEMCPACNETLAILESIMQYTDKIILQEISLISEKEEAAKHGVTRAPTIIFEDFGIKYTGAPIGLETAPFIQTILMASTGETPHGPLVSKKLEKIKQEGSLIVIVTPTCPYCAQAVLLENSLAIMSSKVNVEIVESYENPDIARKFQVTGVPVTIVNSKEKITGIPNIAILINKLVADESNLDLMYG